MWNALWKTARKMLKKHLPALFILAMGTIAVASTLIALSIRPTDARFPSSTEPGKMSTLAPAHGFDGLHEHRKGGGQLDVFIQPKNTAPAAAGEPLQLEASIVSHTELDGVEYSWMLPKDVTLVSGTREGRIGHLKAGEVRRLALGISSPSSENHQLHLHAYRLINGEPNGQIAQYNTIDQPRIDREIREKLEVVKAGARRGEHLRIHQ